MSDMVSKKVLITGGTGSFGRTMAEYCLAAGCPEVRIFSRDETKQNEMRREFSDDRLRFYIGDVRSRQSLIRPMRGVGLVFHAAALKQVPSCEFFPQEAVLTNVMGSFNVIQVAEDTDVECVVCLGTDKAVYPINAMGMTKALMEKLVQATSRTPSSEATRVCCVRYGNVMMSRGSVIPLFIRQIRNGDAVTVTEPTMTRFMLPLEQAVDLVRWAFGNGRRGDILVRKAPAATLADLICALQSIFEVKFPTKIIGVRHGEKIFETLATREELSRAEDHGDYLRIPMDERDLNYETYYSKGDPDEVAIEDYTSHNTRRLNVQEIEELLLSLPEFRRQVEDMTQRAISSSS